MDVAWNLQDTQAIGTVGRWSVRLHPASPADGLQFARQEASWGPCPVLSVRPLPEHALTLEEAYVRESDLIVRFGQSDSDTYAFQLNWQLLPGNAPFAVGVELWVSTQTSLLAAKPQLEIASGGAGEWSWEIWEHARFGGEAPSDERPAGPAALISKAADGLVVWLVEPSDQRHVVLETSPDQATQRVRLFGHFMEKGVIRRARMRFLVAEGDVSEADLVAAYQEFARSPLPLTA